MMAGAAHMRPCSFVPLNAGAPFHTEVYMRWFCAFMVAVSSLVGCASQSNSDQSAQSVGSTPQATHRVSETERKKMRTWWNVTTMALFTKIDSVDGISLGLKENPSAAGTNYYVLPDKFNDDWHSDDPPAWDNAVQALQTVVSSANDAIDTTAAANTGDTDKIEAAVTAVAGVKQQMCSALAVARRDYVNAGGEASDLRYAYNSEWSDPRCTLIDGSMKRATLTKATILFQASEMRESFDADHSDPAEQMFLDGHARRYQAGTVVTVIERRNPDDSARDSGVGPQCRVRIANREWWTACSTLSTS